MTGKGFGWQPKLLALALRHEAGTLRASAEFMIPPFCHGGWDNGWGRPPVFLGLLMK